MLSYADYLSTDVWDLVPKYFGLSHFGWVTKIYINNGSGHNTEIKEKW